MPRLKSLKILLFVLFLSFLAGCATTEEYKPMAVAPKGAEGTAKKQGVYHKVVRGQTLWQIAQGYGVSINDIIKSNNIPNGTAL